MKRKSIIAAALVAILATGAAGVAADSGNEDDAREVAAVLAAPTSLSNAIKLAEAMGGGRAVAAGAEEQHGKVLYEVTTTDGKQAVEWRVDVASGKVISHDAKDNDERGEKGARDEDERGEKDVRDNDERGESESLPPNALTALDSAVTTAEQHLGGKALEAEYEREDGKTVVEVKIVKSDGTVAKVLIDAANGRNEPARW